MPDLPNLDPIKEMNRAYNQYVGEGAQPIEIVFDMLFKMSVALSLRDVTEKLQHIANAIGRAR